MDSHTQNGTKVSPSHENAPNIVVIGLQDRAYLDSRMYKRLRQLLDRFAKVHFCATTRDCNSFLSGDKDLKTIKAVLVVDAGITQNREVASDCARYVRLGGRLVFGGSFANYMPNVDVRRFFQHFSKYWEFAGVRSNVTAQKTTQAVTDDTNTTFANVQDRVQFTKAYELTNVRREHAMFVIINSEDNPKAAEKWKEVTVGAREVVTENTEEPEDIGDSDDSAICKKWLTPTKTNAVVTWAQCGKGHLGFVCDVHLERETEAILLAMLGLLQ